MKLLVILSRNLHLSVIVSLDSITLKLWPIHQVTRALRTVSHSSNGFVFSQISVFTVAEQLSRLNVHNATGHGPDGLSVRHRIFERRFIPSAWKQSNITLIHNKRRLY